MIGRGRRVAGRGLATSASFLIVFIGIFLVLGTLYTVAGNTAERLADARDDQLEHHERVALTQIDVTNATWNTSTSNFTVTVNNTGETTLTPSDADTIVDGDYVSISEYERVEVDSRDTDVWRPGEQLVLEDADTIANFVSTPDRVRFVTGVVVADASEVSDV